MKAALPPLLSIVTPVYNEEEFLAECIESVLAQTYRNWDYTIVDNCSTDGSLAIARRYAAKDSRIRVHQNQQFLNQLANHNVAVRQISPAAKYCKVVLGDDWIFPECLEKMAAVAEEYPSIGVVSAYQQGDQHSGHTGLPSGQRLMHGREASRGYLLDELFVAAMPTAVLYRADLVRNRDPFYVETDMYADLEACLALFRASDLGFVHQVLTFRRDRWASIGPVAADIGTRFGSSIGMLFTYGREYLTSAEFEDCLDRLLCRYYRFLGRRAWVERDREFWSYHRRAFGKLGIGFSRARLAKAAVGQLCGSMLQPKGTVESVRRLLSLRSIRNRQMRRVVLDVSGSRSSKRPIDIANTH